MKGFKFLVLGTMFAKLFGLCRELIIIAEYGYSKEISFYFSLIAILSVVISFSSSSVINAIAFPIWLKAKNVFIRVNYKTIIFLVIICSFLYLYNHLIFSSHDYAHLKFIISIIIIPLILNLVLYSMMIYLDLKKEFLIVNIWNGFLYLTLTFFLIDFGTIGLIYSRLITLIFTVAIQIYYLRNEIRLIFENYNIKFNLIGDTFLKFVSVNNVVLFTVLTRIYTSLIFQDKMALVNYTLIIVLTFYTMFSRNLNSQLIKNQIITSNLEYKSKVFYWSLSSLFFGFLILCLIFFPSRIYFFDSLLELREPIKLSLFVFIPFVFLGYLDLLFQSDLNQKKKKIFIYFLPIILCLAFYHLIIFLFFV